MGGLFGGGGRRREGPPRPSWSLARLEALALQGRTVLTPEPFQTCQPRFSAFLERNPPGIFRAASGEASTAARAEGG